MLRSTAVWGLQAKSLFGWVRIFNSPSLNLLSSLLGSSVHWVMCLGDVRVLFQGANIPFYKFHSGIAAQPKSSGVKRYGAVKPLDQLSEVILGLGARQLLRLALSVPSCIFNCACKWVFEYAIQKRTCILSINANATVFYLWHMHKMVWFWKIKRIWVVN